MPPTNTVAAATAALLQRPEPPADRSLELYGMERDRVELVKRTIAKGATDDELALFLTTAKQRGLDPFARQIYFIVRNGRNGRTTSTQVAIDGFRSIAAQTGEMDGQKGPFWRGEKDDDKEWVDAWCHDYPPAAAMVRVFRKGHKLPYTGIATLRSYYQKSNDLWDSMPDTLLEKCAEAKALRKGFPSQLGGFYIPEEMDQAGNEPVAARSSKVPMASVPPAEDPVIDAEIVDEKKVAHAAPSEAKPAPAPAADTSWPNFLADLAKLVKAPTEKWSGDDVVSAFKKLMEGCPDVAAVIDRGGPWLSLANRKCGAELARIRPAIKDEFDKRSADLRNKDRAAKGGAS